MSLTIQDGGLIAGRLSKLLGLQGRVRPELEEFIIPTITVADLSEGGLPPVSRHCSLRFTEAAVVGESPLWRMEVPPGVIAVIDAFGVIAATDTLVRVNFGSSITGTDIPTQTLGTFTDGRLTQQGQVPAATVLSGTRVGNLGGQWARDFPNLPQNEFWRPNRWVVGSGVPVQFGFLEWGTIANQNEAVDFFVEWDEYQIF